MLRLMLRLPGFLRLVLQKRRTRIPEVWLQIIEAKSLRPLQRARNRKYKQIYERNELMRDWCNKVITDGCHIVWVTWCALHQTVPGDFRRFHHERWEHFMFAFDARESSTLNSNMSSSWPMTGRPSYALWRRDSEWITRLALTARKFPVKVSIRVSIGVTIWVSSRRASRLEVPAEKWNALNSNSQSNKIKLISNECAPFVRQTAAWMPRHGFFLEIP